MIGAVLGCVLAPATRLVAKEVGDTVSVQETRVVSAPLDPRRGAFDIEAAYGFRSTNNRFGENGFPVQTDPPTRWQVHVWEFSATFGITDRAAFQFRLPLLLPSLRQEDGDAAVVNPHPAPGDTSIEAHWRIKERRRPFGEWLLTLTGLAPTGVDAPGDPGSALATGTGIPEFGAGVIWRRQIGATAATIAGRYAVAVSQVVPYATARYEDGTTGPARLYPGDLVQARIAWQVEPIPAFWVSADVRVEHRGPYRIGTTSARRFPAQALEPVEDTDRLYVDMGIELAIPLQAKTEIHIFARYRFFGKTLEAFASLGLEAYSLPPGPFAGAKVAFHF